MLDHRNLVAWQVSRAVVVGVLRLARHRWQPWASALFDQLQRASLSVQLNIAEGYAFGLSPTYRRHLGIAYGSCVETIELIELAAECGLLRPDGDQDLLADARRSRALLIGLLRRHRPMRGTTPATD
ncbi:MAG: four helix bundle protein [Gemmatimonadales bacterium]